MTSFIAGFLHLSVFQPFSIIPDRRAEKNKGGEAARRRGGNHANAVGIPGGETPSRRAGGKSGGIHTGTGQTGSPAVGGGRGRPGGGGACRRGLSHPLHPAEHFQTGIPDGGPDGPRGRGGFFEGGHGAHRGSLSLPV